MKDFRYLDDGVGTAQCPYCGETVELDEGEERPPGVRAFVEDCAVCCRPIEVVATTDEDGQTFLETRTIDD